MILEQEYNRDNYLEFLNDFLPDFSRDARDITLASQQFSDIYSLGSSQNLDLQILEVKVKGSLDKRVSIATDAFKLMKATASYRTLVAFYSEDSKQWRLSLMTAQPTINEGKVVTKLSNPRRFSYLLGPGSKLNTPSKQLITKGKIEDFDDLSKRFALEVVNNEFYKEVAKLYDELVGNDKVPGALKYPGKGEVTHEFAVRLMGRVIFCWFLREKRSDKGTPLVSANILSREAANQTNYYHAVLAPLFFEVLNKHLRSREEKFQKDEYATIPYLNGGLFSPDTNDHYRFDKALQLSVPGLVDIPDAWLHKLFDLLELYNFTVDENTSYDVDLSIDPEMLGRIFENLLARINPETGETVRKSTGSFYTPREIVEYMVDESLKEYLKTETGISEVKLEALTSFDLSDDEEQPLTAPEKNAVTEALSKIKVLDPACGSGAFPIGILQKIVFMLQQVDPEARIWFEQQLTGASSELRHHLEREYKNKNFDYLRKLGVIRESIYGVDIQPIATEISRLRCFLTLIVDQSVEDSLENRGVEPLPNLDFKFVTANSLIPLEVGAKKITTEQTGLFEDQTGINELKDLRDDYFSSHNSDRELIKSKFLQAQNQMLQRMLTGRHQGFAEVTQKLSSWNPFSHESTGWFDPEWMFGIGTGFDIVIGNPPYYKENDDRTRFEGLRDLECYQGKMDVWYLFGALGVDLLHTNGVLAFIATNNWTTNSGASKFRGKILEETKFISLLDFGSYMVFESASIQTMVMLFQKVIADGYTFDYRRINSSKPNKKQFDDLLSRLENPHNEYLGPKVSKSVLKDKLFTFYDSNSESVLTEMELIADTYLNAKEVAQGIVFPQDYVNKKSLAKLGDQHQLGDGIFVLSTEEKSRINLNQEEDKIIKPYFTSKQLGRYKSNPNNEEWVIYTNSSFKPNNTDEYPSVKTHLDKFSKVITSVNHPYGLHRAREEKFFTGEKIISLRKSPNRPAFTYTDFDCYISAAFYSIKTSRLDMMYLTGVLNSKLIAFWLLKKGKLQGNNYQIDKDPLLSIPLVSQNKEVASKIKDRVQAIYSKKGDSETLETEIDDLVYKLYGLSPEKIKFIEGM